MERELGRALTIQASSFWFAAMGDTPDTHGHARQFAVLGKRMKTMQADRKTDIAVLGKQIAKRDTEQIWRDKSNLRWQVGL